MSDHIRELPIPDAAAQDDKAIEIVRVWAAGGQQHVSLAAVLWEDPAAWGILLVDLAKHAASSYEQMSGQDRNAALARIKNGFDAEWGSATDMPSGNVSLGNG